MYTDPTGNTEIGLRSAVEEIAGKGSVSWSNGVATVNLNGKEVKYTVKNGLVYGQSGTLVGKVNSQGRIKVDSSVISNDFYTTTHYTPGSVSKSSNLWYNEQFFENNWFNSLNKVAIAGSALQSEIKSSGEPIDIRYLTGTSTESHRKLDTIKSLMLIARSSAYYDTYTDLLSKMHTYSLMPGFEDYFTEDNRLELTAGKINYLLDVQWTNVMKFAEKHPKLTKVSNVMNASGFADALYSTVCYTAITNASLKTNVNKSVSAEGTSSTIKGFNAVESNIINEAKTIINSSEFAQIKAAHGAGQSVTVNIGGRIIQYEPGLNASGMTMFGENGFLIGNEAFTSTGELSKTVLHELYRLNTSASAAGVSAELAAQETRAAFDFAEKAIKELIK